MADDPAPRVRYGEAFWRAHHQAWKRRDLNQREYCEAQGLSLKAFGNWRAKFKAEPQPPPRKVLYRRGGASHSLGHSPDHRLGHTLGHVTYPSFAPSPGPIVPPARVGHRRRFSEADRRQILAAAAKPGASVSEVARRYGIARRVLCARQIPASSGGLESAQAGEMRLGPRHQKPLALLNTVVRKVVCRKHVRVAPSAESA